MTQEERKEIMKKQGYCRFCVYVRRINYDDLYLCYFYDDIENRENVINEMLKYRAKNGFTWTDKNGLRFTANDLIIKYESYTGEFYGKESYCEIFDYNNKRINKN